MRRRRILVRGSGLAATMSDYLVQRIKSSPKITLHPLTEITALNGDAILREVTWTNRETGASETRRVGSVFVMIGAEPNTSVSMIAALSLRAVTQAGANSDRHLQRQPPAFSRSETCGRDRSSAWLPGWVKDRSSYTRSIVF